jgi:hypothetical protein
VREPTFADETGAEDGAPDAVVLLRTAAWIVLAMGGNAPLERKAKGFFPDRNPGCVSKEQKTECCLVKDASPARKNS